MSGDAQQCRPGSRAAGVCGSERPFWVVCRELLCVQYYDTAMNIYNNLNGYLVTNIQGIIDLCPYFITNA
jgi:hypothetical protein